MINKIKDGGRQRYFLMIQNQNSKEVTRPLGEHLRQFSDISAEWFLRRCNNKIVSA